MARNPRTFKKIYALSPTSIGTTRTRTKYRKPKSPDFLNPPHLPTLDICHPERRSSMNPFKETAYLTLPPNNQPLPHPTHCLYPRSCNFQPSLHSRRPSSSYLLIPTQYSIEYRALSAPLLPQHAASSIQGYISGQSSLQSGD